MRKEREKEGRRKGEGRETKGKRFFWFHILQPSSPVKSSGPKNPPVCPKNPRKLEGGKRARFLADFRKNDRRGILDFVGRRRTSIVARLTRNLLLKIQKKAP